MSQRILALARYLFGQHVRSITGALHILSALAMWLIFFNPGGGRTPEPAYFLLLVGLYSALLAFLATLAIAARANRAISATLIVPLPSRVEYLAALLLATLGFVWLVLLPLCAVILLLPTRPEISLGTLLDVPPLWMAVQILAVVLALHATDFVAKGWSRTYVYGVLALLLFSQSVDTRGLNWLGDRLFGLASWLTQRELIGLAIGVRNASAWVTSNGGAFLAERVGLIFWPFRAISAGVQAGQFSNADVLAPAILLLYATILFMIAADLFATKDLLLTE